MRVVYMAKDKPSARAALDHLVEAGDDVACVVAEGGLADAARELGLPVASDTALYARLAGDATAAPDVGPIEGVDLVLSFLFWKRIRRPLIELPRLGCLNFHPAPLPDFRGLGGYNIAILEGLAEWGASAHFVDDDFDTGDLIRVDRFPIDPDAETAWSLDRKTQPRLLDLFRDVLDTARAGAALPRAPQSRHEGRYIDRDEFERGRQVRPDDTPDMVARRVRAYWYPPFRGATLDVGGQSYTLVSDALLEEIARKYRS